MKIVWQNALVLIFFASYNYLCLAKDKKQKEKEESLILGALFDREDEQSQIALRWVIRNSNLMSRELKVKMEVVSTTDCFSTSKILCNMTEDGNGLVGIFGPQSVTTAPIAQSLATTFQIPHIQINWRHSASYSEQETVINFYPDPNKLAEGLAVIVKSLQWKNFVILYENDDGLIRMQEILKLQNYDENNKMSTVTVRQLGPGPDYRTLLKEIKSTAETQFILDCETDHILPILQQAKEIKLLEIFHKYFLTSLDAHTLDLDSLDTNANITTVRIFDPESHFFQKRVREWEENENMNEQRSRPIYLSPYMIKTETALMYDAATTFINSVSALQITAPIETRPLSCDNRDKFYDGIRIFIDMIKRVAPPDILTAPLQFNHQRENNKFGQRTDFLLYLIQGNRNQTIGTWSPENPANINLTESGSDKMKAILQNLQKETVIVASRLGAPYLMPAENPEGKELVGKERYEGYSKDLLDAIARILEFNYDFSIVADYGKLDPKTKQWNGLIRELLDHRAHLAICDLTITHQRREAVDFSMPFMTLGISILYKQETEKEVNMFAFLDPFSIDVWIYTATLYLTVSIILFFIARMAPGDWENPHPCEQNPEELENIWDLKNCLWLTLGSIMTQGCDILPKGISSRMATSMWWFFSLIMTSSYTANLAAFLTTTRMEAPIDGAEALSKQTKIKYGVVAGGATEAFFRESNFSTYQRMWTTMVSTKPSVFERSNDLGVHRVRTAKNGQYAFLMESSQIEYEVETKCDLKQVGTWLDSKGYGIAMPQNSAYRSAINTAILKLQEDGELQKLKNKWWKEKRKEPSCSELNQNSEGNSSELALANVGGVFLVLGAGVAIAFVIAILEFLWNVKNVAVEEHMTYCQALKVELIFALNVWITKKRVKPQISESSSSSHSEQDSKSITHSIIPNANSLSTLKNIINKRSISRED